MKCLSLWQPWASLLAAGVKRVETRGWYMRHRGPLLIHAAKKFTNEQSDLCGETVFLKALHQAGCVKPYSGPSGILRSVIGGEIDLPLGAIVGRVDVADCILTDNVHWAEPGSDYCRIGMGGGWQFPATERPFGDYSPGRFAILCSNFTRFAEPIPYRGAQGLFDVPDEVVPEILARGKA